MQFQIKNRFTAAVMFECELSAEVAGKEYSFQLGFAVKKAVEARANLADANLADANLAGANLAGAYLADANLVGADLARANLADANLARANLADANLARANLADANLAVANLAGADLAGADLAGAYLADANLARANLADANLADANLADANLAGADLAGAYLADANQVIDAGVPNGWRAFGWLREGFLSIRVGCREKRIDEAREYWANKEDRREVLAALDYIQAIAKLRCWPIVAAEKKEAA